MFHSCVRAVPGIGLFVLLYAPSLALVAPAVANEGSPPPRIGLVLGGGGARGAAHIGVIEVLEEMGIRPDCITGTSMGAIVGGLYAAGMRPMEMRAALANMDWRAVFRDTPPRRLRPFRRKRYDDLFLVKAKPGYRDGELALPRGAIQGQTLTLELRKLVGPAASVAHFDRLPIPFRAVATDIATGDAVILDSGDLPTAMRASMSIAGVIAPVELDGRILVDGGISDNLPVAVARATCADIVIVSDVGTRLRQRESLSSGLAITNQLVTLLTRKNSENQLATLSAGDVLIQPDLTDIQSMDFPRTREAVERGVAAARLARERLAPLANRTVPPMQRPVAVGRAAGPPVIAFVAVNNTSTLDDRVIRAKLRARTGEPLDLEQLHEDLAVLYGLGQFERVEYALIETERGTGLRVDASAKSWGPTYLEFGVTLQSNFDGESAFNLASDFTRTELNPPGGEWIVLAVVGDELGIGANLYQPLDPAQRWFIETGLLYQESTLGLVPRNDATQASLRVDRAVAELFAGRNLGLTGQARIGLRGQWGDAETRDFTGVAREGFRDIALSAGIAADTLDSINFPHTGVLTTFRVIAADQSLGADRDYLTADLLGAWPFTRSRFTVLPLVRAGTTLSGDLPEYERYFLGGFPTLSGIPAGTLSGRHHVLATLMVYGRVGEISGLFPLPVYVGGSLEAGGVWEERGDIGADGLIMAGSLFLGAETPIGPLYLGTGIAEGGHNQSFLYLGRTF